MRLTRVYVEGPLSPSRRYTLSGSAASHVARVLRLRAGDALTLFDGSGGEYRGRVQELRRDEVLVDIREHEATERESPLRLTLAQGISRGERMDWVVQKATELGVATIVPVFTERSIVQLDAQQASKKIQHWQSIAVAACEQSGRNRLPQIAAPGTLYEYLEIPVPPDTIRLLLSPRAERRLTGVFDQSSGSHPGATRATVVVLIGPEGGLSDLEQEAATSRGFVPVRLGPRVLRTETAALAALTVLQQQLGDL